MDTEIPQNPPEAVRTSCAWVVSQAQHVSINAEALAAFAAELAAASTSPPDFSEWHYTDDVASGGRLTAQYVLVLDALNFCFWPSAVPMEYDTLALGLRDRLRKDSQSLSAAVLASVGEAELGGGGWTTPALPNLPQRVASLNELGRGLQQAFHGSALELLQAAQGSACALVRLLLQHFPCFNDSCLYTSSASGEVRRVHFYKRAQILCGDVWAAFGMRAPAGGEGGAGGQGSCPAAFRDIHALTAFADYRLPQLLRDKGVLVYSPALGASVDAGAELASGGGEEVEIRAATVEAVERLRACSGLSSLSSVQLDWVLWNAGERLQQQGKLSPHHRTRSTFY